MWAYLACSYIIFNGVDGQTQDVIIMAQVKALRVLLSVINHSHSRYVVDDLSGLSVEQIAPAVGASVTEKHRASNVN